MAETAGAERDPELSQAPDSPKVIVFRCANSSRPGASPVATVGETPRRTEIDWPVPVREIALPCSGKLQPEHLLKAVEAGADAVCVIACAEDNCHYLEGSCRASRRVDYVRGLLDELGLGGERLLLFHLPGSAQEDMALAFMQGDESSLSRPAGEELSSRLAAIGAQVAARLQALAPNPLRQDQAAV